MTTIKSYTDIEQSKKLAEFLPLESADNVIVSFGSREVTKTVVMPKETLDVIRTPFADIRETTICWSLAALLSILHDYTLQTNTDGTVFVVCESKKPMISDAYSNPVDACMAMIEKLNELNLL